MVVRSYNFKRGTFYVRLQTHLSRRQFPPVLRQEEHIHECNYTSLEFKSRCQHSLREKNRKNKKLPAEVLQIRLPG